jgi:hypothetical protein
MFKGTSVSLWICGCMNLSFNIHTLTWEENNTRSCQAVQRPEGGAEYETIIRGWYVKVITECQAVKHPVIEDMKHMN